MNMHSLAVRTAIGPAASTVDRLDEIHGLLGAIDIMADTLEGYQAEAFSRVVQAAQDKVEALQAAIRAAPEAARRQPAPFFHAGAGL